MIIFSKTIQIPACVLHGICGLYFVFISNSCGGFIQFGQAIYLEIVTSDWVDLGNLSIACITRPETCGPEGAAVALWIKINTCNFPACVITSMIQQKTGFYICCSYGNGLR